MLLRYEACQALPVPAITPPCNQPGDAVVYSRILDRFRIDLADTAPEDPHALQRDWLARLLAAAPKAKSPREILLDFLLDPATSLAALWGRPSDAPLLLATVDLDLASDGIRIVAVTDPDNAVRALLPSVQLVAESLLGQRLLGGALPTASTAAPFQVVSWKVVSATEIRVALSATPHAGALAKAFEIRLLDPTGWTGPLGLDAVAWDERAREAVLTLAGPGLGASATYQLRIAGESPTPLVSAIGAAPLMGILGDTLTHPRRPRDATIIDTWPKST